MQYQIYFKVKIKKFIPVVFIVVFIMSLTSCATKKDLLYLNGGAPSSSLPFKWSEMYIQPNDIISVKVTTEVPELAVAYNITNPLLQNNVQGAQMQLQGYLVSNQGDINIPVLGVQKMAGLTLEQAEKQIQESLVSKGFLKNPVVVCRLLNAKFTVLGEVKSPGTYTFFENNLTLLQALGLAGDLTINGIRKKVTIIRTEKGVQTYGSIDLTKSDWFTSPYYFIKPNDVIIIDPNSAKVKSAGVVGNAGNIISIISVLMSSFLIIKSL
ncbi:polysaccharide biosynthesis/export family protein [Flavobacterium sp.]|uniref:polysaccharide biosynthesis/export family protein n=1 Tax=Flavobacterium sp. TaxID=239 RepID=UPI0037C1382C